MATKTIPWNTGSGNIIIAYTGEGDDTVTVSSDTANTLGVDRSQVLTFKTTGNAVTRQVTVKQAKKQADIRTETVSAHPTSYDSNYSAYSVSGLNQGETDSSSSNYATINLTRGSGATTSIYYNFALNIPSNATIKSVTCTAKCYISSTQSNRIATREVRLYSGSTAKGSAATVGSSTSAFTVTAGTWTAAELNNAKIRIHAVRGTNSTNTNYYFRFYGATLTVEYEYEV